MAKSLTLTAMLLVLWLAMSVGTWAEDSESWTEWLSKSLGFGQDNPVVKNAVADDKETPSEEQIMAEWLQVLQGAEVALEADKRYTASAMIAGVVAKFNADDSNFSDKEKIEKFQASVKAIQQAVDRDHKAKATALIKGLVANFKSQYGNVQRDQQNQRGVMYLETEDSKQPAHQNMKVLLTVEQKLQEAFQSLHQEKQAKAQAMLKVAVVTLNQDESLTDEEKSKKLTEFVMKAEKSLNKEQQEKAQQLVGAATTGLRFHILHQQHMEKGKTYNSADPASGPSTQGGAQNINVLLVVEQKFQAAFQALQQGQVSQAQEMLKIAVHTLAQDKSLTVEQKTAKLTEFVQKAEKFLNKETQVQVLEFIEGAKMGLKIQKLRQADMEKAKSSGSAAPASGPATQESAQNINVSVVVEQKFQAAFQAFQQGQVAQAQEMLKIATLTLGQVKSLTVEQKIAKLIEFVQKVEKSLNKDTQVQVREFIEGAKMGLKIQELRQADMEKAKTYGSTSPASSPISQGNAQNINVSVVVEQKFQAAFQALQQGQVAQAQEILKTAALTLSEDKSLTIEQKTAKLTNFVQKVEKSLNKDTHVQVREFIEGAKMGLKIQELRQTDMEKVKSSGFVAPASGPVAQGNAQNINVSVMVEQKFQAAFQALQQGQVAQAQEILKTATLTLGQDKSLTVEQKTAKLTDFVQKVEKSLNKDIQVQVREFIVGAKMGLKFQELRQADMEKAKDSSSAAPTSSPAAQGSAQNINGSMAVELKFQAVFQALQQGQVAQAQEMLKNVALTLSQDKSLTVEQKKAKLTEFIQKVEKSLSKDTQVQVQEFIKGAKMGLKIQELRQADMEKAKTYGSTSPASSPVSQGSAQNINVSVVVEQKFQAAFQALQQGQFAQAQEMLKTAALTLGQVKSLTIEQKIAKLTDFVQKVEKSLNKDTQVQVQEFIEGAKMGLKIQELRQADMEKAKSSGLAAPASGSAAQGSAQNINVSVVVEQKFQAAFQALQQGQVAQAQEILKTATLTLGQDKSLTIEQKTAKLTDFVQKVEKSLNKDIQVQVREFIEGAKMGLKFQELRQADMEKAKDSSSAAPTSSPAAQGSAQNINGSVAVELKFQAVFQALQQGQVAQAQEMLKNAALTLSQDKSLTVEQKKAKLTEFLQKVEKSLNKDTQVQVREFIEGAKMGLKIQELRQEDMEKAKSSGFVAPASGSAAQGSAQNINISVVVEQKFQAAFQALQQGQFAQAQEMLKIAALTLGQDKSLTVEQKTAKLTEFIQKVEKSLNKDTQVQVREFIEGAKMGLKIQELRQAEMEKAKASSSTAPTSGPATPGSAQNINISLVIEQKFQAAFQALQQGQVVQAQEILKVIALTLGQDKSLTVEQKTAKLTEFFQNVEKSLNKDTQVQVLEFIEGAKMGLKIQELHQADMEKAKTSSLAAPSSGATAQGSAQNINASMVVELKFQAAFQALQQGQVAQAQELLKIAALMLGQDKSLSVNQKTAKLTEFVQKVEKSLNKETQVQVREFIEGAKMGLKIQELRQTDLEKTKASGSGATASGPTAQGSSQNMNVLLSVEQKLQAAFQAIHQEQQAKAQAMLKTAVVTLNQDDSLTDDEKSAKLTEFVKKAEKSLDKDQQQKAAQLLGGATVGLRIHFLRQQNMENP
ncbi:hypothetical protein M0R45_004171 [Rubus argutus]|uniref:Uncharacterized protein n=1 Tax=Rubus argutus TaxID=59490 RepID=A0AAW1YJ10_RUBAR